MVKLSGHSKNLAGKCPVSCWYREFCNCGFYLVNKQWSLWSLVNVVISTYTLTVNVGRYFAGSTHALALMVNTKKTNLDGSKIYYCSDGTFGSFNVLKYFDHRPLPNFVKVWSDIIDNKYCSMYHMQCMNVWLCNLRRECRSSGSWSDWNSGRG